LIKKGAYFLDRAYAKGNLTKYHLEAGIAFHHTQRAETGHKWEAILQLYNGLLLMEYSPIAALNRTYALAKANGKQVAIVEAEQLNLSDNHFYHSLLGNLYSDLDNEKALNHFQQALMLANSAADKAAITKNIGKLTQIIAAI
jgi:predicted RNA polymerase sigma factor